MISANRSWLLVAASLPALSLEATPYSRVDWCSKGGTGYISFFNGDCSSIQNAANQTGVTIKGCKTFGAIAFVLPINVGDYLRLLGDPSLESSGGIGVLAHI